MELASNLGWNNLCKWVDKLPTEKFSALISLTEHGWSEQIPKVINQANLALQSNQPDKDTTTIIKELVSLLDGRKTDVVATITNGIAPTETANKTGVNAPDLSDDQRNDDYFTNKPMQWQGHPDTEALNSGSEVYSRYGKSNIWVKGCGPGKRGDGSGHCVAAAGGDDKPASSDAYAEETEAMHREYASLLSKVEQGGFTYNPISKESPTSGFAVSVTQGREKVIKADSISENDIAEYLDANKDIFETTKGANVGGWFDKETGKIYLDISVVTPNKEQAIEMAQKHNQEGIYDLSAGQTIITKPEDQRRRALKRYRSREVSIPSRCNSKGNSVTTQGKVWKQVGPNRWVKVANGPEGAGPALQRFSDDPTITEDIKQSYREGYAAATNGERPEDNPYNMVGEPYKQSGWTNGWQDGISRSKPQVAISLTLNKSSDLDSAYHTGYLVAQQGGRREDNEFIVGQPLASAAWLRGWDDANNGKSSVVKRTCILPSQSILPIGEYVAASKAWYSGEAVQLTTLSGVSLSVTVNHPIFTEYGIIAAGKIKKHTNLLRYSDWINAPFTSNDIENSPSIVDQVFESFNNLGVRTKANTFDFHGDGKFIQGQVDIVRSNRFLGINRDTESKYSISNRFFKDTHNRGKTGIFRQRTGQGNIFSIKKLVHSFLTFLFSHTTPILLLSRTNFRKSFVGSTVDSRKNIISSFCGSRPCVSHSQSFRSGTEYYPTDKQFSQCLDSDTNLLCETSQGISSLILHSKLVKDRITKIRHFHYSGWVYDFETTTGKILTESILVSNCRLSGIPKTGKSIRDDAKLLLNKFKELVHSVGESQAWKMIQDYASHLTDNPDAVLMMMQSMEDLGESMQSSISKCDTGANAGKPGPCPGGSTSDEPKETDSGTNQPAPSGSRGESGDVAGSGGASHKPGTPWTPEQVKQAGEDYQKLGTKSPEFKSWFGDWESDPSHSSKVVNEKTGEPQEEYAMKVYHGSGANFDEFDPQHAGAGKNLMGIGFYFTEDQKVAENYLPTGGDGGNVYEMFLNIRNPFFATAKSNAADAEKEWTEAIKKYVGKDEDYEAGRPSVLGATLTTFTSDLKKATNEDGSISNTEVFAALKHATDEKTVNKLVQSAGYDGIRFIGDEKGSPVNPEQAEKDSVPCWVCFDNKQMKSTKNQGTFDPTDTHFNKAISKSAIGIGGWITPSGEYWKNLTSYGHAETLTRNGFGVGEEYPYGEALLAGYLRVQKEGRILHIEGHNKQLAERFVNQYVDPHEFDKVMFEGRVLEQFNKSLIYKRYKNTGIWVKTPAEEYGYFPGIPEREPLEGDEHKPEYSVWGEGGWKSKGEKEQLTINGWQWEIWEAHKPFGKPEERVWTALHTEPNFRDNVQLLKPTKQQLIDELYQYGNKSKDIDFDEYPTGKPLPFAMGKQIPGAKVERRQDGWYYIIPPNRESGPYRSKEDATAALRNENYHYYKPEAQLRSKSLTPEQKERAKRVDLIVLPDGVEGTRCGNCASFRTTCKDPDALTDIPSGTGCDLSVLQGFCNHPKVQMYVSPNMCCNAWNSPGMERVWQLNNKSLSWGQVKRLSFYTASEWLAHKWASLESRYGRKGALTIAVTMLATMPIPGNIPAIITAAEAIRGIHGLISNSIDDDKEHEYMAVLGVPAEQSRQRSDKGGGSIFPGDPSGDKPTIGDEPAISGGRTY